MSKEIKHSWLLNHQADVVWKYLTDASLLSKWLMENDIQPIIGHCFTFKAPPMPQYQFDGIVYCEILEVQEPERLVFSWKGGTGETALNTTVTFTLTALGNDTLLELIQTGFRDGYNDIAFMSMNAGWGGMIINRLKALLNG